MNFSKRTTDALSRRNLRIHHTWVLSNWDAIWNRLDYLLWSWWQRMTLSLKSYWGHLSSLIGRLPIVDVSIFAVIFHCHFVILISTYFLRSGGSLKLLYLIELVLEILLLLHCESQSFILTLFCILLLHHGSLILLLHLHGSLIVVHWWLLLWLLMLLLLLLPVIVILLHILFIVVGSWKLRSESILVSSLVVVLQ